MMALQISIGDTRIRGTCQHQVRRTPFRSDVVLLERLEPLVNLRRPISCKPDELSFRVFIYSKTLAELIVRFIL